MIERYFERIPNAAPLYSLKELHQIFKFQRKAGRPRAEAWHSNWGKYTYQPAGGLHHSGAALLHARNMMEAATKLLRQPGDLIALQAVNFNSVLANLYESGKDSVAWHSDDEPDMGPDVVSFSYGATRRFSVRNKVTREVTNFDLEHGDALVMYAGAQDQYEHCIRKTSKPVGERISLTIREHRKVESDAEELVRTTLTTLALVTQGHETILRGALERAWDEGCKAADLAWHAGDERVLTNPYDKDET